MAKLPHLPTARMFLLDYMLYMIGGISSCICTGYFHFPIKTENTFQYNTMVIVFVPLFLTLFSWIGIVSYRTWLAQLPDAGPSHAHAEAQTAPETAGVGMC